MLTWTFPPFRDLLPQVSIKPFKELREQEKETVHEMNQIDDLDDIEGDYRRSVSPPAM